MNNIMLLLLLTLGCSGSRSVLRKRIESLKRALLMDLETYELLLTAGSEDW